ncbi:MAG TPA: sugar transferase [Hyphomicrobiaceae bacterium]|nr:sugar transferase [Hyphomicrobiaceae bacterium]
MPDYLNVLGAAILIVTAAVGLGFLFNRLAGVARSLPVIQAYLIVFALVGARVLARLRHAGRGRAAALPEPSSTGCEDILIVGINPITELYLRSLAEYGAGHVRVMGLLTRKGSHAGRVVQGHRILGRPEQIAGILVDLEVHGVPIQRVVVTVPFEELSPAARSALREANETFGIRVEFFAEHICGPRPKPPVDTHQAARSAAGAGQPGLRGGEQVAPMRRYYWQLKRAFDVTAAICAIVLLAPLLLLLAVLVVIDIGAPAIFWQQRPGIGGRPFRLYKFRTMARPYDADGNRLADDDRLTGTGRFLRRSRLDELPQLFNILIGEMSFVGPRPLLATDQCPAIDGRLAVRPGITGWAQIKGGRKLSAPDKAALDVWYVNNASLRVDFQILVGTLGVVLLGERVTDGDAIREAWRELGGGTGKDAWSRASMARAAQAQSPA